VGDIGPKIGFDDMDNGFLRLDNIRIPRENMLSGHAQVEEDGTYSPPFNDKIMYAGMLGIRANLPIMVAWLLSRACTIAVRYSLVRRQSELVPG
jgi:acyl-CoA oxidase